MSETKTIWWRTKQWNYDIKPFTVVKESEQFLTVLGLYEFAPESKTRIAKVSDYNRYWPTREAAIAHLKQRLEKERNDYEKHKAEFEATIKEVQQ